MSQLRSAIEDFASFDPNDISAEELAAMLTEAVRGNQMLSTAISGWVRNLSDRGGHHQVFVGDCVAL